MNSGRKNTAHRMQERTLRMIDERLPDLPRDVQDELLDATARLRTEVANHEKPEPERTNRGERAASRAPEDQP